MGLRTAKILQAIFVFMFAWYLFSVAGSWHWLLAFLLVVAAVVNAVTVWMVQENRKAIVRLCRFPLARRYTQAVCWLTGQRMPVDERPGAELQQLLLKHPRDFTIAAARAKQIVRGHDTIIDSALERVASNMTLRKRRKNSQSLGPLASFLIVGPEGVGKRYASRVLSKLLYRAGQTEVFLCERLTVGELIGSKQQAGDLLEIVRQEPFQTLVFENVEKASPEVAGVLTRILTSGELSQPGSQSPVSFRNTVVFVTTTALHEKKDGEFSEDLPSEQRMHDVLRDEFGVSSSLLSAFDEMFVCEQLDDLVKAEVISLMMKKECSNHGVALSHVDPEIVATQVVQVDGVTGFSLAPNRIKKLLSKPLVAASAGHHDRLSLRIRPTEEV